MHGLSTLNRLLGKKNKEVSRSTSNLSKSHSNLDSSSQHKKISPILSNNVPFEQTFRVTVYLPKNQLYVERIGAKTKLGKLMSDVCDSKNLSFDKYEFRHPTDISQVFDNDKTIGEVGFNELRLILKTESRYNSDFHRYHADDMMKYRSSNVPDSVSSSEISRNLKNVSKTSPYSSTNSLNSLDSTGMNKTQPPVAPMRKKKRIAPRPPSENSIPEQEIFNTTTLNVFKEPHSILPRKNFHVSSPQLFNSNKINNNNNINNNRHNEITDSNNNTELRSVSNRLNAITRPSSLYVTSTTTTEIAKNLPDRQRNNSESSEIQNILKDSGSKQNSLERTKKKSPAPVPPTRKSKPTPSPRTTQDDIKQQSITEINEVDEHESFIIQQQQTNQKQIIEEIPKDNNYKSEDSNGNISKVLLNNSTATEGPSSIDGPISIQIISTETTKIAEELPNETESAKLPVVVSKKVHTSHPDDETRSTSEEEEMTVNIYNVTKSVVTCEKAAAETTETNKKISFVEEKKHYIVENNNVVKEETTTTTTRVIQEVSQHKQRSPSPEWTYTLPAPPMMNDTTIALNNSSPTDRNKSMMMNSGKFFTDFSSTVDNETILSDSNTTVISAETHIEPIINDRRKTLDDSFVINSADFTKQLQAIDNGSDNSTEIVTSDLESGANDSINVIEIESSSKSQQLQKKQQQYETNRGMEKEIIVEDFQRSRLIITRSDSFHSIGQQKKNDYESKRMNVNALPQRSTSFLSLNHSHKAELSSSNKLNAENVSYSRQKSTSELSISDVPSLQSLEVMKNILNSSRKNSLQDSSSNSSALVVEEKKIISSSSPSPAKEIVKITTQKPISSKEKTTTITSDIKSVEKACVDELKEKYVNKKLETQMSVPVIESVKKQPETNSKWRYSGPPKINFSTWNERPKIEVSVMSDEDYKFGGVSTHHNHNNNNHNSTMLPRDFKNHDHDSQNQIVVNFNNRKRQQDNNSNNYDDNVTKNKEAERHLPKVLGVEYKKDVSVNPVELRRNSNENNKSSSTSSEIISNSTSKTLVNIRQQFQRPNSMDSSSTKSINISNFQNPSTQFVSYNRLTGNHKKFTPFTPVVHGFAKLDNISETHTDVKSLPIANKITDVNEKKSEAPLIPTKPAYLRSTSAVAAAGDLNHNSKLSPTVVANSENSKSNDVAVDGYDESPFSQSLRRTGLIEKRLNDDKQTASIFGRVIDKPTYTSISSSIKNDTFGQAKVEEKVTLRQLSMPASIPPPPKPPVLSTTTTTFRKSAPVELDSRDELFDAIKTFNKDSLRKK